MSYNGYAQEGTSETRASKTRPGEYQGWANYETWAVGLWLSNDEGAYNEMLMSASETDLAHELAQWIQEYVEKMPEIDEVRGQASLAADLLGAALSEVDWYELAEGWLQTAKEAAEYSEA